MTPQMYRNLVTPTRIAHLVGSDNYKRRVSIMYQRQILGDDLNEVPLLYIYTRNSVQNTVGGNGIFVLPGMQFQVELDRKDYLDAIASENAAQLTEGGVEVSVVVEALEDDASVETYRIGGENR